MRRTWVQVDATATSQGDPSTSERKMASICRSVPATQRYQTPLKPNPHHTLTTWIERGVPTSESRPAAIGSQIEVAALGGRCPTGESSR